MHSWRVLILPFLDQKSLYDQYDLREPWDGPNNSKLLNSMPSCFACPNLPRSLPNLTNYAVITGPGTMFPEAGSVKLADVTDGLPETLMVVEVARLDIPWTAPIDLDIRTMSLKMNDPGRPGISSPHTVGAEPRLRQRMEPFPHPQHPGGDPASPDHDRRRRGDQGR